MGDYEKLYKVLNFAMPFNEENHKERDICAAPYAITNCYHLVPSFRGRAGFSFLTGSVAMLERSVYNWMFGVRCTLDGLQVKPCLPKAYANSGITFDYMGKRVTVRYNGYGNKLLSACLDGKEVTIEDGMLLIDKDSVRADIDIVVNLGN